MPDRQAECVGLFAAFDAPRPERSVSGVPISKAKLLGLALSSKAFAHTLGCPVPFLDPVSVSRDVGKDDVVLLVGSATGGDNEWSLERVVVVRSDGRSASAWLYVRRDALPRHVEALTVTLAQ